MELGGDFDDGHDDDYFFCKRFYGESERVKSLCGESERVKSFCGEREREREREVVLRFFYFVFA